MRLRLADLASVHQFKPLVTAIFNRTQFGLIR
jgi:hypothetical protein